MSFPKYPAYKGSGVEWLSGVPVDWKVTSLQRCVHVAEGQVDPEDEAYAAMLLIAPNHVESGTGRLLSLESTVDQGAESGKYLCEAGDVVYSKIRPALRKVCIAPQQCLCSADMYPLRPGSGVLGPFLFWFLLSEEFSALAVLESQRVAMPKINRESLKVVPIILPSIEEQMAIAAFLDCETAKIDALIEEQRRLIELLKEKRQAVISQAVTKGLDPSVPLKDSGVEWLGEVPAHWVLAAVNHRYEVQLGKMLDEKKISGTHLAPYLRNVDVQWDRINTEDLPQMDFTGEDVRRFSLSSGDLLVCEGGEVGRAAIWQSELSECYYQKALHRLRRREPPKDNARFMFYILRMATMLGLFESNSGKSTIAHLTAEALRRYRFAFPPVAEQGAIAAYLDKQTTRIDALMGEAESAMRFLQERRSALISAAVTGKIDVRGLVPQPESAAA